MLDRILAEHREKAADDPRLTDALVDLAKRAPEPRNFDAALRRPGLSVIAEVKRRSPSKGEISPDLDPASLAQAYASGGAACVSVLTDETFFGGSMEDLVEARAASGLPALRKDFTVSANDICDARVAGADAVLLIVAALTPAQLTEFHQLAEDLAMACLVEAHSEREVELALASGARIVGVNQRDLKDFSVDPERAARLAELIPDDVLKVAESGISGREDASRAFEAGYDAILVGELLVRSADPAAVVKALRCS
ncbi:MAG TPA: indole-3-glycerol phosphate synthase TrpC [Acidimicrobiales bacterium]|nr:indole-3-glycerol phosphate synthase TrpC [Acidimicrobiales bacterium]